MNENKSTLLDVDGDGEVKALTDGVILNAYLNGASLEDVFQFRSINSPASAVIVMIRSSMRASWIKISFITSFNIPSTATAISPA